MLCAGNLPQVGSEQGRHRATVWPHYTQVPVQRIEETIRPTPQQRGVFEALKTASSKAADGLRSSCPAQMPTKMVDRLDSVDARLAAMLSAVEVVRPALEEFYASLTDEQKARFNSWGESQRQDRAISQ
jgi:LTXXQ motif family protein